MAGVCQSPTEMDGSHALVSRSDGGGSVRRVNSGGDDLPQRIRAITSSTLAGLSVGNEVYVAVGREVKEGKQLVVWALRNNPNAKKVVLLHVRRPFPLVPMLGGWFPPNLLSEEQVRLHRLKEMEKMDAFLNEYVLICRSTKVQAEKLIIEMDDVAKGLIIAIEQNGITKLVMGASAYSKKTKNPNSKTARAVWKDAHPSCNIWLVYKGDLLITRGATQMGSMTTSSSHSTGEEESDLEIQTAHELDEELGLSSIEDQLDDPRLEEDLYHRLRQAHDEAAKFRDAAHEESQKLHEAQMELLDAKFKTKQMEKKYAIVTKLRKQLEETAIREQLETEKLRNQRDEICEQFRLARQQQSTLEDKIAEMDRVSKDFEAKLLDARGIISSLQRQRDELLQEQDNAVRELEELRKIWEASCHSSLTYTEFTYAELEEVTQNFDSSFKIGQGAYGWVYKAFLRHTAVAIKILNPDSLQGHSEFLQEEIMRDPQVAADGHTYEAEAIRGWLESGNDTSPMTNLKLSHNNLIPNLALRTAIQEWLQQH